MRVEEYASSQGCTRQWVYSQLKRARIPDARRIIDQDRMIMRWDIPENAKVIRGRRRAE